MDRTDAPPGVFVHTLGCPKNDADSRALSRALTAAGIRIVAEPGDGDHVVINTCGFIREAKEESVGAILDACSMYGGARVVVTGCLVERYRQELQAGIPEVAGWFGLADHHHLVESLRPNGRGVSGGAAALNSAKSYAYVKISDGCSEGCTFCAIPGIKGPYSAVSPEAILAEVDRCLSEGARELVLVGQDTAVWRWGEMGLPELIDRIATDDRARRIRLMYLQPDHVDEDLLRFMAGNPKLCRYLDIPCQHAHPGVLQRMGRFGSAEEYLRLLERARLLMPDVSVRSTFIVGFPGETEEQFEALLEFVSTAGFDHAGGFIYSPEEGTPAFALKPRVGWRTAKERLGRLTALLASVSEERRATLAGTLVEVMIDSREGEAVEDGFVAVGRTGGQAPEVDGVTYVEGDVPEHIGPGQVLPVRVVGLMGYDLVGRYEPA